MSDSSSTFQLEGDFDQDLNKPNSSRNQTVTPKKVEDPLEEEVDSMNWHTSQNIKSDLQLNIDIESIA